jgi:tRNA pseudouridine55 synthase
MDGILNLYKPLGITSTQALTQVRRITGERHSGHAGSLDPLAEGVLLICLGGATKLVEALMNQPKVYRTVAALDVTSPSFDLELDTTRVPVVQPPTREQVAEVLRGLEGVSEQVPPATSAVKLRGRPAYELARAGRTPVLMPRRIQIYWIHVHRYDWPLLDFEVACGRGTYIRALIRDIGARLATGGCLTALQRRAVGPFWSDTSWTLERLQSSVDPAASVLPLADARRLLTEPPVILPQRPVEP